MIRDSGPELATENTEDTEIKNVKSEIRISKFETNPNDRNTKFKTTELATEATEEKIKKGQRHKV